MEDNLKYTDMGKVIVKSQLSFSTFTNISLARPISGKFHLVKYATGNLQQFKKIDFCVFVIQIGILITESKS